MQNFNLFLKKYFFVLDVSWFRWTTLLLAFISMALLDVFGIGAMGLFVQAVVSPDSLQSLNKIPEFLRPETIDDQQTKILYLGAISFLFFGFRTAVTYLIQVYIFYFNGKKRIALQERMFKKYLFASLSIRKERNFADMLHHLNFLPNAFMSFSTNLISIVSNVVLFAIITTFLAMTSILATISISALFIIAGLFYYFLIRNRSSFYGILLSEASKKQFKHIREGIGALDEIQILNCQNFFSSRVQQNLKINFNYNLRLTLLNMIPRPLAEFMLLTFIIGFSCAYFTIYGDITKISSVIGMFALAGLRMVPAASQISACINGVKGTAFAVELLYSEIRKLEAADSITTHQTTPNFVFKNDIVFKNVSFTYPDGDEAALKSISLSIKKGNRTAIVGKSGSGKTTMMNILLGNLPQTEGEVLIDGLPLKQCLGDWRNHVFYMPQSIYILDDNIINNVALGQEPEEINMDKLMWAIEQAQLGEHVKSLPKGVYTKLGDQGERLSGGQRQRIGIARALYFDRDVLVMDEATSALDEETEKLVKQSIRNLPENVTVIMITHHLKTEDIYDQIIRL